MTKEVKKILILEDEEDILNLLLSIFSDSGYQILSAIDGQRALGIIRIERPDIILSNLLLPGLNGYDICRRIKSDPSTSQTKVVIISGMTQNPDQQKAWEAGADAYFAKPFNPTELLESVEKLLNRD